MLVMCRAAGCLPPQHFGDEHVAQYDAHLVQSHGPIDTRVEDGHERQRRNEVGDDDVDDEQHVDAAGRRLVWIAARCRARAERCADPRLGVVTVNAQRHSRQRREEPQQERQTL